MNPPSAKLVGKNTLEFLKTVGQPKVVDAKSFNQLDQSKILRGKDSIRMLKKHLAEAKRKDQAEAERKRQAFIKAEKKRQQGGRLFSSP